MMSSSLRPNDRAVPELSIVIVNWNTRELLLQCLRSIYADTLTRQSVGLEVIVVDNGSTDGSIIAVQQHFPQTQLIENHENLGFARANNQAIASCQGHYILLLNPDTEVLPGALLRLVQFIQAHPHVAGVGPRILNPDRTLQTSCWPFPSLSRELWYLLHLDLIWSYAEYRMDRWEGNTARRVDVLLGACLLLRRQALDQIGLLDEEFFMYSEEVDLCLRLFQRGWSLFWIPEAEIVHYGGQSTKQAATEMFRQLYQSKIQYFRKHYPPLTVVAYKLVLLLTSVVRLGLSPLTWMEDAENGKRHRKLAANYADLIKVLPRL